MKHFIAIMCMFKNESANMKEWLDHYIWQGVDHFYLIDNASDDNYQDVLANYKDMVTLYHRPAKFSQVDNYNEVFNQVKGQAEWLGAVDMDEFFYGTEEPMRKYFEANNDAISIYCQWLLFGSRDEPEHPASVRKTFVNRDFTFRVDGKCFVKPLSFHFQHIHGALHEDGTTSHVVGETKWGRQILENEKIRLNHYPIQSRDWFAAVKMTRGAADGPAHEFVRNWDYFKNMDFRCTVDTKLSEMVTLLEQGIDPYKK